MRDHLKDILKKRWSNFIQTHPTLYEVMEEKGEPDPKHRKLALYTEDFLIQERVEGQLKVHGVDFTFLEYVTSLDGALFGDAVISIVDEQLGTPKSAVAGVDFTPELQVSVPLGSKQKVISHLLSDTKEGWHVVVQDTFSRVSSFEMTTLLKETAQRSYIVSVIESNTKSSLSPILEADISHEKIAMNAKGIAIFHAEWKALNLSVSKSTENWEDLFSYSSDQQESRSRAQRQGYAVKDADGSMATLAPHNCGTDTLCPTTLRHTEDAGVFILGFTAGGSQPDARAFFGEEGTCIWRHGGIRCDRPGMFVEACSFSAPKLTAGFGIPYGCSSSSEIQMALGQYSFAKNGFDGLLM